MGNFLCYETEYLENGKEFLQTLFFVGKSGIFPFKWYLGRSSDCLPFSRYRILNTKNYQKERLKFGISKTVNNHCYDLGIFWKEKFRSFQQKKSL